MLFGIRSWFISRFYESTCTRKGMFFMDLDRQWFAIRTKQHRESLALANFHRQGFRGYMPITQKVIRHARQLIKAVRPFFPGYIFLNLSPEERQWSTINSTYGAVEAVNFGRSYPAVPDYVIEALRARENAEGHIDLAPGAEMFKKGQRVELIDHGLEGLSGLFQACRGADRAIILLEIMNRSVKAAVPLAAVRAA